ncbi:hypothetical protein Cgig2_029961 [Carnegiea gigantea]|uniref:ER lumen protein-retaining receptor n=1 Tax=Carnegiea gigantea TaxID=171969 RepID=A0A9Q1JPB1_9CARY|nr:hypothetical protein Cgig2_029961 [Carnegiea gigantea]
MNIFRLAGDMTHLASVLVLLLKIHTIKSCAGISLKTQELYAIVFATRYLDIFTDFISVYNTVMKLIYLSSSFSIVWYMRRHKIVRRSYDKDQDTFRHWFLVLPCLVMACLINEKFSFKEVMWTFSLYLEAVAILPQLVLLQRTRNIDNLTGQYVFLLGILLVATVPVKRYLVLMIHSHSLGTDNSGHIVCYTSSTGFIATSLSLILSTGSLEKQQKAPVTSISTSKFVPVETMANNPCAMPLSKDMWFSYKQSLTNPPLLSQY